MLYRKILRPVLFRISPLNAYTLAIRTLHLTRSLLLPRKIFDLLFKHEYPSLKTNVFGIDFPNPIGLAAGLDKNAEYYNDLGACGFGFVEIGTLTPGEHPGPEHRQFCKIHHDRSILSDVGIANRGVIPAINRIKNLHPEVIIAANISHDSSSGEDEFRKDYEKMVSLLYDFVDFFIINASYAEDYLHSPLEDPDILAEVMDGVLDKRSDMDVVKPVLVKISPDIPLEQLDEILHYSMASGVDGIVVGDAMRNRKGVLSGRFGDSGGFVSGAALFGKSLEMVRHVSEVCKGRLPVIASGGIMSAADAVAMIEAGASLVELMSAFIYDGPKAVGTMLKHMDSQRKNP